ncbi:exported hypothetical protein [Candidatus Zixiibacteriota bacterium]|nr:exported hypothetical protein [candidate division Zixibacteria bacterium]
MGKWIITFMTLLLVLSVGSVLAQDSGVPDTLRIDSVKVNQGSQAVVNVNFFNDEMLSVVQVPLHFSSPDISIDSVSFAGSRVNYINNKFVTIESASQQVLIASVVFFESYIPTGDGLFCKIYFNIPNGIPDQKVIIDSMTIFGNTELWLVDTLQQVIYPVLKKGKIIIGNPVEPPTIGVSPASFNFSALLGGSSPDPSILHITNTGGGTLQWSATKKSLWLNLAPSTGTAPSNIQVYANTAGLDVGDYYDTITVSCTGATNNPVLVPVTLHIALPPPIISFSPPNFNFNAIADSANPPNQTLNISNIGQGTLQWQVSNAGSWLQLSPTSGTGSGAVTVAVDITGLPYGIYYDTITISDPAASNSPRKAPVRLEIASGLPVLAVDSPLITVIVDTTIQNAPDRSFLVYNAGGGTMTFSATENSTRILSLTPSSGTAPLQVTASLKTVGGDPGHDFYDTVWVSSPEAINSPLPVVFHFHFVWLASRIAANSDSISASYVECGPGNYPLPPPTSLLLYADGGDPLTFQVAHNAPWLRVTPNSGASPLTLRLQFNSKGYSPGTYFDTIVVSSEIAINNPLKVPVKMIVLQTSQTPLIYTDAPDTIKMTAQVDRKGRYSYISVNNANPGCMNWSLNEDIPWVTPEMDTTFGTTYPWAIGFIPDATGLTMGHYVGTASILSDDASNSPYPLNFALDVWRFHGDANNDGIINILDIVYIVKYLYKGGAAPIPEKAVGDCNCDFAVNLLDIAVIVDYLYKDLNPICGNPI